jgi:hypothetical protein
MSHTSYGPTTVVELCILIWHCCTCNKTNQEQDIGIFQNQTEPDSEISEYTIQETTIDNQEQYSVHN